MGRRIAAKITGVAGYVPPRVVTNFDLEKRVDTNDEWIRTRTGIRDHAHRMGLDGDASLAFQIHVVQHLGVHLAVAHRARKFEQPVAQRRLAMVDVRDDGEIAEEANVHRLQKIKGLAGCGAVAAESSPAHSLSSA